MMRAVRLITLLAGAVVLASPVRADNVTLQSLVQQMSDLSLLTRFPDPPYVTGQFSSYDRASVTPRQAEGWFANRDRGYSLYDGTLNKQTPYFGTGPQQANGPDGSLSAGTRVARDPGRKPIGQYVWVYASGPDGRPVNGKLPRGYIAKSAITVNPTGHVLAEMDGPGCITRIWSANPNDAGHLRIYLDNSVRPALDAPMDTMLSGTWQARRGLRRWSPFPDPIAAVRSRGASLYFPICYAKHCKVCVDHSDIYYHIDYRTYPKGTEVETFGLASPELMQMVPEATAALSRGQTIVQPATVRSQSRILPGDKMALRPLPQGPRTVVDFRLSLNGLSARSRAAVLRSLVLVGTFDGAKEPQIWCPLGDFFGTAPDANAYQSLPFTVSATTNRGKSDVRLACRWWMPYEKNAAFEIQNVGSRPVEVMYEVSVGPYHWDARSMYFHARWRSETFSTRPFRDWNYCDLQGEGVFVGDALSVMNPVPAWWGEGDEKIYVDGESFPSWFGTGTEDYYGFGWSDPHPFQHPYHNQTRADGPGNYGRTSVNRFHILDAIPFTKSFRFDMEVWHWTPNVDVNYAAVSYWYARPGATDRFQPVDPALLRKLPAPPPPHETAGAIEAEHMKFLAMSKPEFEVDPQNMVEYGDKWSNNEQLWGRPTGPNQWVKLRLPVPADGEYRVTAYLTKAKDYGIIRFKINDQPVGKAFDGYAPKVTASGPVDLGTIKLKKGGATLEITAVGTNPRSEGDRYMWGLDCIALKPGG